IAEAVDAGKGFWRGRDAQAGSWRRLVDHYVASTTRVVRLIPFAGPGKCRDGTISRPILESGRDRSCGLQADHTGETGSRAAPTAPTDEGCGIMGRRRGERDRGAARICLGAD